jgi:hypothetical protein
MDSQSPSPVVNIPRSQVLRNFDLLELIFEHFGSPSEGVLLSSSQGYIGSRTKQALLWACLTTRSFVQPATNILWRHMWSIWPLFHLLNLREIGNERNVSIIEHYNGRSFSCRIQDLVGFIKDSDIQRMHFYSRCIRVLHVEREASYDAISSDALRKILNRLENVEMFPSLRHLFIWFNQLDEKQFMLLSFTSSPNLRTLHLKTFSPCNVSTASSFLCAPTPSKFQQLQSLQILHISGNFSNIGPSLPILTNLRHLQLSAVASFIPPCFLRGCASSMASLQTLKIYLFSDVEELSETSHDLVTFDSLSRLELGGFPEAISRTLDGLHTPLLSTAILSMTRGQLGDISNSISKFITLNQWSRIETVRTLSISFESLKSKFTLCSEGITLAKLRSAYDAANVSQITTMP